MVVARMRSLPEDRLRYLKLLEHGPGGLVGRRRYHANAPGRRAAARCKPWLTEGATLHAELAPRAILVECAVDIVGNDVVRR